MAYSVNWLTKVVSIPQGDLIDLGDNKYKLDLYEFKNKCRSLEAEFTEGLSYDPIVSYYKNVDTGDVILAKVVLLVNGYTVTFEDGQYAVLLDGANTNLHNFTNVNQVSIRPNNSTGLQDLSTLLAMAYMDRVVVNTVTGQSGVSTPIGTLGRPSGNIVDAVSIASKNGISRLYTIRDLTLDDGDDVSNLLVQGIDASLTTVIINDLAVCNNTRFSDLFVIGTFDGDSTIEECGVGNIEYFSGTISHSALMGRIILNGTEDARIHECSMGDFAVIPVIDMNDGDQNLIMSQYTGNIQIENCVDANNQIGIGLNAGHVIIDASCKRGTFTISGDGTYTNNGGPNVVIDDKGLNNPKSIAKAVLDELA